MKLNWSCILRPGHTHSLGLIPPGGTGALTFAFRAEKIVSVSWFGFVHLSTGISPKGCRRQDKKNRNKNLDPMKDQNRGFTNGWIIFRE